MKNKNEAYKRSRSYEIYGREYDCYFYNNGDDEGVSVFNDEGKFLFKFDEKISEAQAVVLLKGYVTGVRGRTAIRK
jgi:hypothetical protein